MNYFLKTSAFVKSLLVSITLFILLFSACSESDIIKEPDLLKCPDEPVIHSGEATYYSFASGAGACLFDSTPGNLMIGAMNQFDYENSLICGACVQVTGPLSTIVIRIVDLCPGCSKGSIDLSPLAFSMIADTLLGRVPISWQIVPCDSNNPVKYRFKEGSSQWWTAVQIRNHRYPIYSFEYLTSQQTFKQVNRMSYNYFVEPSGMGPGPFTFRITDIYGHMLTDSLIILSPAEIENGEKQFPLCDE